MPLNVIYFCSLNEGKFDPLCHVQYRKKSFLTSQSLRILMSLYVLHAYEHVALCDGAVSELPV